MAKITYDQNGITVDDAYIPLEKIIKECAKVKQKKQKLSILEIKWTGFRGMDDVWEKIALPLKNIETIKRILIGKTIDLGEINGKHSSICYPIEEKHLKIYSKPKDVVEFLKENPSGHDCNHSFLCWFSDVAIEAGFDDISEEELAEFDAACWLAR